MKTLLFIFLLFLTVSFANSQTLVRMPTEKYGFWTVEEDTMHIYDTTRAVKVSVFVPDYSSDSAKVTGGTYTVDGMSADGIVIPPGYGFTVGDKYGVIDSLTIEAWDKVWLMMLIDD